MAEFESPMMDDRDAGDRNLWVLYRAVAAAVGDRPAIIWRGNTTSHSALLDRAGRFGGFLARQGLGVVRERHRLANWEVGQDLVGLYMLNGPEYLEATFGSYAARTVPFNVNYRYVEEELRYLLDDAGASVLVFHARFARNVSNILGSLRRTPVLVQVADDSGADLLAGAIAYEDVLSSSSPVTDVAGHSSDDLYVVYTGGTTGMPKGTLWRHEDLVMAALGGEQWIGLTVDDIAAAAASTANPTRFVPNAPFMHGSAHWIAHTVLLRGGVVVVNSVVDHFDPVDAWSLVESERATRMLMVGESVARPLIAALEAGSFDASSLSLITLSGAATSSETKRRIVRALPQVTIIDAAGASETGGLLTAVDDNSNSSETAVFKPRGGATVLDHELRGEAARGHEEPGWLASTGAIPLGYLGDEAKTRRTFPMIDGRRWSVPGDRARLRDDGAIELLGRDAVTINTGGEKVFAEEVEAAILRHPAVRDVVVVGRPSERWGHEVVAVVAFDDDQGEPPVADLRHHLQTCLARYKVPKDFVVVPAVFRGPAGKADYVWARERAMERRD